MVPFLEFIEKVYVWFSRGWRKMLVATAVGALFLLNLSAALAADGGSAWHGSASATTLSSPSSSIGGRVWYDDNGDGVQDEIEVGLEGVTVHLYRDNDGILVDAQTSGQDGSYRFSGLPAGDYIVQVPETVKLGLGEYALTTDNSLSISLGEGKDYSDANFGYEALASPAPTEPTAVTLSSFMASSGLAGSASRGTSFHWPWLVVLATLAAGGSLWIRRQ